MNKDEGYKLAYSKLGECADSVDSVITRLMTDKLANPQMLSLAAGFTDNRILPEELVRRSVERLTEPGDKAHLQYGMNAGKPGLRQSVTDLLGSYPGESGLKDLDPASILITNGSQQGLYILVQMLCNPGDIVLVESPSYFVFLELLEGLGVKAVSIPSDSDGRIDFAALEKLVGGMQQSGQMDSVKLVYLMGAFANPSTRCICEEDKIKLADFLKSLQRPIPVVEDMAYRELYFEEPYPARSMLSLVEWDDYPVIYAGTFTKPFATGLKIGFIVCRDHSLLTVMAKIKGHQDFGSAHFNQAIVESVLNSGEYFEYLAEIRGHYLQKRDVLIDALVQHGLKDAGWEWDDPLGGLLLWARGPEGTDTRIGSKFHACCVEKEILYVPGDLCFAEGKPYNCVRLSFGALEQELIPEATQRFCEAARMAANA